MGTKHKYNISTQKFDIMLNIPWTVKHNSKESSKYLKDLKKL